MCMYFCAWELVFATVSILSLMIWYMPYEQPVIIRDLRITDSGANIHLSDERCPTFVERSPIWWYKGVLLKTNLAICTVKLQFTFYVVQWCIEWRERWREYTCDRIWPGGNTTVATAVADKWVKCVKKAVAAVDRTQSKYLEEAWLAWNDTYRSGDLWTTIDFFKSSKYQV